MGRRVALVSYLVLVACSKSAPKDGAAPGGEAKPGAGSASAVVASPAGPTAIFSAPIAGAHLGPGEAIGVGLVVATKSITAARVDAAGHAAWVRSVVGDVKWSQDAELHAFPVAAGALVVWRGPVGGKSAHVAALVSPDGRVLDGPFDIGSPVCTTDDGVAWSESEAGSKGKRVKLRTWGADGPHDVSGPALTDDITLTCGAHAAYVTVEGDEGTETRVYTVGNPSVTAPLSIAPKLLGSDEERDLFGWAEGDEAGIVRIAQSGSVTAADIHGGALTPLHADGARIPPEDDVVAVDADPTTVWLLTTHDESDHCPEGRGGSSVHALRIGRQEGGKASLQRLEPSACERDVGPFWSNRMGTAVVVGWAERASRAEKTAAPIVGVTFQSLQDGARSVRLPLTADAVADAGCDASRCYVVALMRDPGANGMTPEAIRVFASP